MTEVGVMAMYSGNYVLRRELELRGFVKTRSFNCLRYPFNYSPSAQEQIAGARHSPSKPEVLPSGIEHRELVESTDAQHLVWLSEASDRLRALMSNSSLKTHRLSAVVSHTWDYASGTIFPKRLLPSGRHDTVGVRVHTSFHVAVFLRACEVDRKGRIKRENQLVFPLSLAEARVFLPSVIGRNFETELSGAFPNLGVRLVPQMLPDLPMPWSADALHTATLPKPSKEGQGTETLPKSKK